MDLYLLAELKTISLKVTTVDMQKPPPDFRTNFQATPPPILIDRGDAILENEKIERHIMKVIPGGHNLFVQDKEVATLVETIFSVSVNSFYLDFPKACLKMYFKFINWKLIQDNRSTGRKKIKIKKEEINTPRSDREEKEGVNVEKMKIITPRVGEKKEEK